MTKAATCASEFTWEKAEYFYSPPHPGLMSDWTLKLCQQVYLK